MKKILTALLILGTGASFAYALFTPGESVHLLYDNASGQYLNMIRMPLTGYDSIMVHRNSTTTFDSTDYQYAGFDPTTFTFNGNILSVATSTIIASIPTPSDASATSSGLLSSTLWSKLVSLTNYSDASATSSGLLSSTLYSKLVALPTTFFDGTWASLIGKPTFKRQETYNGTTNGSGVYTVTFSTPYATVPDVQPTWVGMTDNQQVRLTSVSTSSFSVLARTRTDIAGLLPTFANTASAPIGVLVTER